MFAWLVSINSYSVNTITARKKHASVKHQSHSKKEDEAPKEEAAPKVAEQETDERFIKFLHSHEEKIKNMGFFYIEYPKMVDEEKEQQAPAPAAEPAAPAAGKKKAKKASVSIF